MDPKLHARETASRLLKEARHIRSRIRDRSEKVKVTIFPDAGGGQGSTAIGMVVTINSPTFDLAFKYAERLREMEPKCNCVCSGETEITCTCPG